MWFIVIESMGMLTGLFVSIPCEDKFSPSQPVTKLNGTPPKVKLQVNNTLRIAKGHYYEIIDKELNLANFVRQLLS